MECLSNLWQNSCDHQIWADTWAHNESRTKRFALQEIFFFSSRSQYHPQFVYNPVPVAVRSAWFLLCFLYLCNLTISHHSLVCCYLCHWISMSPEICKCTLSATKQTYLVACQCCENLRCSVFCFFLLFPSTTASRLCHVQQQQPYQQICICQSVCFQNAFFPPS